MGTHPGPRLALCLFPEGTSALSQSTMGYLPQVILTVVFFLNLQLLVQMTCIDSGGWHWTGPTSTGCSSCSFFYNDVLKFDPITLQWTNVGAMSEGRYGHGVSVVVVKAEDVEEYCN